MTDLPGGVKGLDLYSACVDNVHNIVNGHRGLGNIGSQNDLAHTHGRAVSGGGSRFHYRQVWRER